MLFVSRLRKQKAWRCEKHHGARGFRAGGMAVVLVKPISSAKDMYCGIRYISPSYNSTLEGCNRGRWPEVRRNEVQKTEHDGSSTNVCHRRKS